MNVWDGVQLKNGKPILQKYGLDDDSSARVKRPFWFQPCKVCSKLFRLRKDFSLFLLEYATSLQFHSEAILTTIWLSEKICTSPEAKGLENGLHVGMFSVMIALVFLKLEIEWSLWMFWKDSISWYYQKLLLTNSTIFRTRFQTPLAGTF